MQDREVHVADIKKRAEEYAASKATPAATITPTAKAKTTMPKGDFKF